MPTALLFLVALQLAYSCELGEAYSSRAAADVCPPLWDTHSDWVADTATDTMLSSRMTVGASGGGGPGSVEGQLNVVEEPDMATITVDFPVPRG
jgi:hypothetical protein